MAPTMNFALPLRDGVRLFGVEANMGVVLRDMLLKEQLDFRSYSRGSPVSDAPWKSETDISVVNFNFQLTCRPSVIINFI